MNTRTDYDAVIVGASLAGCSTAIQLGRAGARVALVEKQPELDAFKRMCSHYIQSSAVPAIERLGLMEPIEEAGGIHSRIRLWTRSGWIDTSQKSPLPAGVNIRRELLDPIIRKMAADTPGVELMLGLTAKEAVFEGDRVAGVELQDRGGERLTLRARMLVAADGRDSQMAKLVDVPTKTTPHGRFAYAAYFEGPPPTGAPHGSIWLLDPQWAAAFPTDGDLTLYGCMLTKDRLPEFKRDLEGSLTSFVANLPDAPPILESRRVGPIIGKIEMPNMKRAPASRGMALVGDAALATDPLWGVGCGWAFESAEWLAESVAPALLGEGPLDEALERYSERFHRQLDGHARDIDNYATGRRHNAIERTLFATAVRDDTLAIKLEEFATRNAQPDPLGMARGLIAAKLRRLRPRRAQAERPPAVAA